MRQVAPRAHRVAGARITCYVFESHGFDQIDWPVHRMDFAAFGLDVAELAAVAALDLGLLLGSRLAGSRRLNHPAQTLANFVSRQLDLVVVRPLIHSLQFSR